MIENKGVTTTQRKRVVDGGYIMKRFRCQAGARRQRLGIRVVRAVTIEASCHKPSSSLHQKGQIGVTLEPCARPVRRTCIRFGMVPRLCRSDPISGPMHCGKHAYPCQGRGKWDEDLRPLPKSSSQAFALVWAIGSVSSSAWD